MALLAVAVSGLVGCVNHRESVRTVSHAQLVEMMAPFETGNFPIITTYQGSRDGFDFFELQRTLVSSGSGTTKVRILESGSPLTKRFPLTDDRRVWKRYHPHLKSFGDDLSWNIGNANPPRVFGEQARDIKFFKSAP